MKSEKSRTYRMSARAQAVEDTRDRILQAMVDLWLERHFDDITLNDVADRAEVSRQTVFRQFGTKEELLAAAARWAAPRMDEDRRVEPGDVEQAVHRAVAGYEIMGDANVRALQIEGKVPAIDEMLARGRGAHRSWLEDVFQPHLPNEEPARERMILGLYAATDVMTWKLLRRDFGRSADDTELVMRSLVTSLIETTRKERP